MLQQSVFRLVERVSFTCAKLGHLIEQQLFTEGAKVYEYSVQYVEIIEEKIKASLQSGENLYYTNFFASEDHIFFLMKMDWIKAKQKEALQTNQEIPVADRLKVYSFLLQITDWYIQQFEKKQATSERAMQLHYLLNEDAFEAADPIWQRIATAKERLHRKDSSETEVDRPSEVIDRSNSFTVALNDEVIYIPNNRASAQLKNLRIAGCNHFIRELASKEIYTLQDLPKQLATIHYSLIGVGPTTVEKMWKQLTNRFPHERKSSKPVEMSGEKTTRFAGKSLTIPEHIADQAIQLKDFPSSKKVIHQIMKHNIYTYRDLPYDLEKLIDFHGIGRVRIQSFFDQLNHLVTRRTDDLELRTLSNEERIRYEYEHYLKWFASLNESASSGVEEQLPDRYIGIMQKRFEAKNTGRHITLQQLGDAEGVTRERIRQIINRGNKMIVHHWSAFFKSMKEKIKTVGSIVVYRKIPSRTLAHYVLGQAFESAGIYPYELYSMYVLTLKKPRVFEVYVTSLIQHFHDTFDLTVIDHEALNAYCEQQEREQNVSRLLLNAIAQDEIDWMSPTEGILKNASKSKIVELVIMRYPKGVAIYKEEERLNEQANKFMPGKFVGARDFTAVFSREEISGRLLLWARGVYIHRKFVTTNEEWVKSVQQKAHDLVAKKEFMHVRKLYELVKDEAITHNVPNEYALFSLMRLYDANVLSLERFPMIQLLGKERIENTAWVIQYFEEKKKQISKQELVTAFVDKRGWRTFTIDQILSYAPEIIPYEHGVYTLKSHYDHITEDEFTSLLGELQDDLADQGTISVRDVYENNEQDLIEKGIDTPYILYSLLDTWGIPTATFDRFPDIELADDAADCIAEDRVQLVD